MPEGAGEGTPGEVDGGLSEYLPVLPVASGEIVETVLGSTLNGGRGNDTLIGNRGDDRLFGGQSDDRLFGAEGDDRMFGGGGNDRLFGGQGEDRLYGGRGGDSLFGGWDDDRLVGGQGDDILSGYEGSDTFVFSAGEDRINDFDAEEGDRLILANGVDAEAALKSAVETEGGLAFEFDDGSMLTLRGVNMGELSTDDFLIA